jgi:hypothetical protein
MEYELQISYCVFVVGVILLLCVCKHDIDTFLSREYVEASVDGKKYQVIGSFEGEKHAANMLGEINKFLISIIKHMKKKYIVDGNGGFYEKDATVTLLNRYDPDVLFEHKPKGTSNTAFVANKGEAIGFCLRERESGKNYVHKWNLMQFVSMHEMAHIITVDYGHDDEFWESFRFIMDEAVEMGVYTPVDYSRYPINYCGLGVWYSPYFDSTLDRNT